MREIELKLANELKILKSKYFEYNDNFLYALDNNILELINQFNQINNDNECINFHITYDGKKDIVYIWCDEVDSLIVELISKTMAYMNSTMFGISNDIVPMDYINEKVVIELNYKNKRVIENNIKYGLEYNEI